MKTFQFFFACICICVSLSGCKKEINRPDPIVPQVTGGSSALFGSTIQVNVGGQVFDETGGPMEGVVVTAGFGSETAITDANGVFVLQGITSYSQLGYVTANKPGYFTGSRSFVPIEGTNAMRITMLAKNIAGTFQGNSGGSVSAEGVEITFAPGSFIRNGAAYNGPVSVALNHIDPSSEELFQQMPGALLGTMNNSTQMLRSFGMVGVELTDGAGTEVEIAAGTTAEVRFPVPMTMMGIAPSTIDLWSFDEDLGHWVHEGQAQLEGSDYVANVGHFSWWNCDIPFPNTFMECRVSDQISGEPIGGAQIVINSSTLGQATGYTNQQGGFGGVIPLDETLDIQIRFLCPDGSLNNIYSQSIGPYNSPTDLHFYVSVPSLGIITGRVLNCDAQPVSSGYLIANDRVLFCDQGLFNFVTCTGDLEIIPVDLDNSFIGSTQIVQIIQGENDLGPVSACGESILSGTVTDVDENVYSTISIGDQEWMASNLRVTKYSNGDPIPADLSNEDWSLASAGAMADYYFNNPSLSELERGHYYNWYAVNDSRNVCPVGWHVPSDDEFKELELTLGMPVNEVGLTNFRGDDQNVGGKMKAVVQAGFGTPNEGATNESGFSGGGWGIRSWVGEYSGQYYWGRWWTDTESSAGTAWFRNLSKENRGIYRDNDNNLGRKTNGMSVRCIRD